MNTNRQAVASLFLIISVLLGCKLSNRNSNTTTISNANSKNSSTSSESRVNEDGTIASGTGEEKEKPAAGKGNVQGKVFYNEKPVNDIEVKLCEKFNQYFGGCQGETFGTKTDANGEYLLKNVTPRIYEGLLVKVFNSDYYVFATSGIVQTAKYKIEADKTFFAPDTNLFKHDLKLISPKAGSKIPGENIEIKWEQYPDAAFYKFSIFADTGSGAEANYDFINKRVDGLSYVLEKPLKPGSYTCKVEAYNASEVRLATSASDIKFTVTGDTGK
ncbi:MAG: hypothetical protein C5B55_01800 [Blastocatellia bacterium]|nr:MAG: hypothetical protein C5B55_01800 [Blastocatellia bacterium]